jgi:exonuclease V
MSLDGMASPATTSTRIEAIQDDIESDYGSDFTPEEELIVAQLLSRNAVEDNPIVNDVEHHEAEHTLRIPRTAGDSLFPGSVLLQAAKAAEKVSEQINAAAGGDIAYPDCKIILPLETVRI